MSKRTVPKTEQFLCSKCDTVTFSYFEIQHFADESKEPLLKTVDRIIDLGQCQVAAKALFPSRPTPNEMQECPIYQKLLAAR